MTTLNDPAFFEAAQHLALRIVKEGGPAPSERIKLGFRLCVARQPQEREWQEMLALWKQQSSRFSQGSHSREALSIVGDLAWPSGIPVWEEAAWTVVANVLLNLDETITKN